MTDPKLLDRIQKLFALGTSSNPHEAAAAMEKATAMMEEHGFTSTHLGLHQVGEARVKSTQSISKAKDWEINLVTLIARAWGCKIIFSPGRSWQKDYWARFIIVGHKDKVQLAEYTCVVLLRQIAKGRAEFSKTLSDKGYARGKAMTAQLDGFCKGWVGTIRAKVFAFANSPELQVFIDLKIQEITKGRTIDPQSRGNGTAGNLAGQAAAAGIDLHRPMSGKPETLKLS